MIARTGFDPKFIWGSCLADGVAQKVVVLSSVESRVCLMHNRDKVVSSAVGNLFCTKIKVSINPFTEGNNLISKAHKLATHFSYGYECHEQLWKLTNALSKAHGEWVNICMDLNGTRISARQPLL